MNRFPTEIILNIFIHLHVHHWLQCKLVCRNWRCIMDEYCLFKNVELSTKDQQFEKFITMMEQSPHLATKVEELQVTATLPRIDKGKILNTFPNVRVVKVDFERYANAFRGGMHRPYVSRQQSKVIHPTSTLRILHDSIQCELTVQTLESNLCAKLEELELNFYDTGDYRTSVLLNYLKGLPALKKLALIYSMIGIAGLDKIHENIPTIQEFKLGHIHSEPSEMPADIVLASLVTTFEIYIDQANVDTDCQFYQYICKKYPNVTKVDHFNKQLIRYTPNQRRQVHLNGLLDCYTRIINTNKNILTICGMPNDIDVFNICDDLNCQLEKLKVYGCEKETFFQYLTLSNQSKYVKKLVLHDTKISSPFTLTNMKTLTDLRLSFHRHQHSSSINLTDYLNGTPPSLKHFSLHYPYLKVDPQKWQLYSIKTLDISCSRINAKHVNMISALFPKLVKLKLSIDYLSGDDLHIRLYYPTFQRATFTVENGQRRNHYLSFKSLEQTEFQHYCILYNTCVRVLYQEIQKGHTLTVTTLTEKKVEGYYNGIKLLPI